MRALNAPGTKETTRELTAVVARNTYLGFKEVRLSERGRTIHVLIYIIV